MARTRFRSGQAVDEDFLTEEEGQERFIARDGYGTNDSNLLIEDGYFIKGEHLRLDGYQVFADLISHPNYSLASNLAYTYNIGGSLYLKNSTETAYLSTASEGSFSPVVKVGATTQTLTTSVARYSKVGKTISVAIVVEFTKAGTGDLNIEGLPFTSNSTTNLIQSLLVSGAGLATGGGYYGGGTFYGGGSSGSEIRAKLLPNSTTLVFRRSNSNSNITDSQLTSNVTLEISGSYIL